MKIRVLDRILVCLAGIALIAVGAGAVAQLLFGVPVTGTIMTTLSGLPDGARIAIISAAVILLVVIGVYCFMMLFRHKQGKRGFVTQETENGDVSIAIKSMESMVGRCIECHPEMKLNAVNIDPEKNCVVVFTKVTLASGVSIPLAVGALQREIKQYLTACSGVDVRDVRVQVDTSADTVSASPYLVPELLLPGVAEKHAEETEKDDRPAHQRIFAREEEPVTGPVPAPEQPEVKPEEPKAEEAEKPAAEEPAENKPAEAAAEEENKAPEEDPLLLDLDAALEADHKPEE